MICYKKHIGCRKLILFLFAIVIFSSRCTKLHETAGGNLTPGQVAADTAAATVLLQGVYASLEFTFTSYLEVFALAELSTDEAIAPTRGSNWDDNGQWRGFHQQKYDPNNPVIGNCFKSLGGAVFAATDMLRYSSSHQQQAEARFLRAWAMYCLLDFFDQVPYREPGESLVKQAKVRKGLDALNYITAEINAVENDLPDGPANKANKYAAKVLLMKCYLNNAVYANRANPSFLPADMNNVISLADSIISSNRFSFSANYFDNFSPDNKLKSGENIFTQMSNNDGSYFLPLAWLAVLNYRQGGINGFATLPSFYNKFEQTDKRKEAVYDYPDAPSNPGRRVNVGFLAGQQYDLSLDTPLRSGPIPVIFTPEVKNILPGPNLEMPGIRPMKYAPDFAGFYGQPAPANEFVYFRFTDVLLMKAEAIARGGTPTNTGTYGGTAKDIVNAIRTHPSRGVPPLSAVTLDSLFNERGRELWWENWRRQDMVRFGKFLLPFEEKNYEGDVKYLLFPIPYEQITVNKNLQQNPGY